MKVLSAYEKARIYIEKHSAEDLKAAMRRENPGPVITISRESGIGASSICEKLVDFLNEKAIENYADWTYFDKDLIQKVIEDHHLPEHFVKYLEEESIPHIDSWFSEILGISPSKISILHKTSKTITRLAEFGNVILIGRGSNIILSGHPRAFHIRLVAPRAYRIENAMKLYNLDRKSAHEMVTNGDLSRKDFISKYFHKNINDPLLYHIVVNINLMDSNEVATLIGNCLIKRYPAFFKTKKMELLGME